jgi:hypothetical protein
MSNKGEIQPIKIRETKRAKSILCLDSFGNPVHDWINERYDYQGVMVICRNCRSRLQMDLDSGEVNPLDYNKYFGHEMVQKGPKRVFNNIVVDLRRKMSKKLFDESNKKEV